MEAAFKMTSGNRFSRRSLAEQLGSRDRPSASRTLAPVVTWTHPAPRHGLPAKLPRMRRIGSPDRGVMAYPKLGKNDCLFGHFKGFLAPRSIGRTNAHHVGQSETDRHAQVDGMAELCRRCLTTIPRLRAPLQGAFKGT